MRIQTEPHDPPEVKFEAQAVPHSWFLVAVDLHDQAEVLFKKSNKIKWTFNASAHHNQWDGANRASFLLAGFALENMIKAFLVYENPDWIANSRLSKQLKSHSLTELAQRSTKLPQSRRSEEILEIYESGLSGWARYPCALNLAQEVEPIYLSAQLWRRYSTLIQSYGRKMQTMLRKKWCGPHKAEGVYDIRGFFENSTG